MPQINLAFKPTDEEIKQNKKRYHPCDANMEIFLADSLDLTDDIYDGLLKCIVKPKNISVARFKRILFTKATVFNIFVSGKLVLDKIFDDLEQECALYMLTMPVSKEEFFKKNLCPKLYKESTFTYKVSEDDEIDESYYFPIISKEILEIEYPMEMLTHVLMRQLQKYNVNIASTKEVATFIKTEGWLTFFGVIPEEKAIKVLQKGMVFIDSPDFPDTDSRLHGPYSHALQEYLISKLLEGKYLGGLEVPNEPDISERDLVQADAWLVKNGGVKGVGNLFDIMREKRPNKLKLLDVYPDEFYGFTSPDFINQYLMLNPFRFPCLSTILYNKYAHSTFNYFNLMPGFTKLSKEEQLNFMNIHQQHGTMANDIDGYISSQPHSYIQFEKSKESAVMLKRRAAPLFRFSYTNDDSETYIRARKKAASGDLLMPPKKYGSDEVLLIDRIFAPNNRFHTNLNLK